MGRRRLVDEEGRLLPAARDEALLVPPSPWSLLAYEYLRAHAEPRWASSYGSRGCNLSITQGGTGLLHVERERDYFRPLLLAEPEMGGRQGVLYTFSGEEGTNHVLAWPTSTAAVLMQRMGPGEPDELLTLASALVRSA